MSDVKAVNDIHQAEKTSLPRRRELTRMTRAELVDYIVSIEENLSALSARIEHAYGDEP